MTKKADDCTSEGGTAWDPATKEGCEAAGKKWNPEDPGDPNATPAVPAKAAECVNK